ncbi:hypothetical protein [Actinacidiphila yeochonensis]|uniref:hypothetical protein n=1 Tax=Actinacidiphila yeochonensis TaxID=89050 RepID=UPI0005627C04|nr:hypothetical protein [Actinacidiphila yeochonensis]
MPAPRLLAVPIDIDIDDSDTRADAAEGDAPQQHFAVRFVFCLADTVTPGDTATLADAAPPRPCRGPGRSPGSSGPNPATWPR